jgi:hypothetical protein
MRIDGCFGPQAHRPALGVPIYKNGPLPYSVDRCSPSNAAAILAAGDFAFELVHGVLIFGMLSPQLGIVLKDFHQVVIIASQFIWHGHPACSC